MANGITYGVNFPFRESYVGKYLDVSDTTEEEVRSNLIHLLLTRKGQRLYNPDFGTDLLRFIFEPEDNLSLNDIKSEITTVVKKYLPKLQINEISVTQSTESEYAAVVRMDYTITDDVFTTSDFIIINI